MYSTKKCFLPKEFLVKQAFLAFVELLLPAIINIFNQARLVMKEINDEIIPKLIENSKTLSCKNEIENQVKKIGYNFEQFNFDNFTFVQKIFFERFYFLFKRFHNNELFASILAYIKEDVVFKVCLKFPVQLTIPLEIFGCKNNNIFMVQDNSTLYLVDETRLSSLDKTADMMESMVALSFLNYVWQKAFPMNMKMNIDKIFTLPELIPNSIKTVEIDFLAVDTKNQYFVLFVQNYFNEKYREVIQLLNTIDINDIYANGKFKPKFKENLKLTFDEVSRLFSKHDLQQSSIEHKIISALSWYIKYQFETLNTYKIIYFLIMLDTLFKKTNDKSDNIKNLVLEIITESMNFYEENEKILGFIYACRNDIIHDGINEKQLEEKVSVFIGKNKDIIKKIQPDYFSSDIYQLLNNFCIIDKWIRKNLKILFKYKINKL